MQIPQTLPKSSYFVATSENTALVNEKQMSQALEFIDSTSKEDPQLISKLEGIIKVSPKGQKWVMKYASKYFQH